LKQKLTVCAGLLALVLLDAVPAAAQPMPMYPGPGAAVLPPQEVAAIVRESGFRPLRAPIWRGRVYWVRAVERGEVVRVVVHAYSGRILRVVPLGMDYAGANPLRMRPPGMVPIAPDEDDPRMPDQRDPRMMDQRDQRDARMMDRRDPRMMDPDEFDEPVGSVPRAGSGAPPAGPGRIASTNPRAGAAPTQTPLPRPRPKVAASDTAPTSPAANNAAGSAPSVKPAAPAAAAAKPAPSATDAVAAKPAVPYEQHE
jgi:hypothetical protein